MNWEAARARVVIESGEFGEKKEAIDEQNAAAAVVSADMARSRSLVSSLEALDIPGLTKDVEIVVVSDFDLTMLDLEASGMHVFVKRISRHEAQTIARLMKPRVVALQERAQTELEQELGVEPMPRPVVGPNKAIIVRQFVRYNDQRYYWICFGGDQDGDGTVE